MLSGMGKSKWLVAVALFACCVAPTFISYQPYRYEWDDAGYLYRDVAASQAFWSGHRRALKEAMVSIRPPAMTLLGLPWGSLTSWDAAGKCFVSLAAVISLLVALCLYLLLRIGVKPLYLVVASVCVFASLGPYWSGADAHGVATGYMSDSLLAWTSLAAALLVPYEWRMPRPTFRGAIARGILWGAILSFGIMTKISFFYFVALIVPALFLIRLYHDGLRGAFASLIGFSCSSILPAIYLLKYGKPAFANAKASSFGQTANYYYHPLSQFLGDNLRAAPGMALFVVFTAAALIYLVIKKPGTLWGAEFLALLIMLGYAIVPLLSTNREIRFEFPAIVALPFLTAVLLSGPKCSPSGRYAALAAGLVFCALFAAGIPTRHRADRQSISRCDAVLAQAAKCHAKRIMLATDSPTLNFDLLNVDIDISGAQGSIIPSTMANQIMFGVPLEEDYRFMSDYDQIVFQDREALSPPFTNQRVPEYERYFQQQGLVPTRIGQDLSVYSLRCRP
jgi:hypothetical protein